MLTFWETLTKMEQEERPTHDGYNKWHTWEALQYSAICINFTNSLKRALLRNVTQCSLSTFAADERNPSARS